MVGTRLRDLPIFFAREGGKETRDRPQKEGMRVKPEAAAAAKLCILALAPPSNPPGLLSSLSSAPTHSFTHRTRQSGGRRHWQIRLPTATSDTAATAPRVANKAGEASPLSLLPPFRHALLLSSLSFAQTHSSTWRGGRTKVLFLPPLFHFAAVSGSRHRPTSAPAPPWYTFNSSAYCVRFKASIATLADVTTQAQF